MLIKNLKKYNKLIGLIRRLSINVSKRALLTKYDSFFGHPLDYGDISYKLENENFQHQLEKVQYRACLLITGVQYKEHQDKSYNWCNTKSIKTKAL